MKIAVVGGGMAGARLAQQLAPCGDVDVTLIGEEQHAPYNRVLLAEVLAGRYAPEVVALPEVPGGEVRCGVRVVRIDRGDRVVRCDDGSTVPYDALVLATGSNPVLPPLRGLFEEGQRELPPGVHAFRTMDDCLALSQALAGEGVRAVVIGGGLLGVSAARALAARGAQVVLAQQGEYLMERHLDEAAAKLLRTHLESLGIEVHTECRVRGLRQGRCHQVELADGYRLDADVVVLACGVRPRVGLAQAAGLDVAKGIVVDDELRTCDPDIYAIGDCAQHAGVVYGLAGPAREQADVLACVLAAGAPAAGLSPGPPPATAGRCPHLPETREAPPPWTPRSSNAGRAELSRYTGTRTLTRLTLNGPGPLDIAAFGDPVPAPGDDVLRLSDATKGAYRKVVMRGDRLVGGILLGDLAAVGTLARTWEGDEPLPSGPTPLLHLLTNDGGS
ncbi:FAD-dependent oxidoreductase [Actinacidiphila oryziradicis]|uniref:NAD(P)/FAD-dependent oxidoreductase n=1 Tax=Actinacidiphila oryziradicis TaxID=2571141 RepID=UPI0023EF778C|nr:FAD-dependent oxidoreductase [Actinacidiphila oryziradicis]MCW2869186.1 putative FAD-dependent pyridine nucleotide reductase [Actinacidiphila oryziradicis]